MSNIHPVRQKLCAIDPTTHNPTGIYGLKLQILDLKFTKQLYI